MWKRSAVKSPDSKFAICSSFCSNSTTFLFPAIIHQSGQKLVWFMRMRCEHESIEINFVAISNSSIENDYSIHHKSLKRFNLHHPANTATYCHRKKDHTSNITYQHRLFIASVSNTAYYKWAQVKWCCLRFDVGRIKFDTTSAHGRVFHNFRLKHEI